MDLYERGPYKYEFKIVKTWLIFFDFILISSSLFVMMMMTLMRFVVVLYYSNRIALLCYMWSVGLTQRESKVRRRSSLICCTRTKEKVKSQLDCMGCLLACFCIGWFGKDVIISLLAHFSSSILFNANAQKRREAKEKFAVSLVLVSSRFCQKLSPYQTNSHMYIYYITCYYFETTRYVQCTSDMVTKNSIGSHWVVRNWSTRLVM